MNDLTTLKLKVLCITALAIFSIEVYYYLNGVPIYDCIKDWFIGMIVAIAIVEYTFRIIKRDREEVEKLKNFIQDVVENANCGIVVVDKDLNIKLWNKFIEDWYKVKKEDALNKNIKEFFGKKIKERVEGVIETGKSQELGDIKINGKWCNLKIKPLKSSGNIIGACLCIIDLTSKIKEKQRLEELMRIKEVFVDILSHDLLNIITVIKGSAKLAKNEENVEKILDIIEKNAERLEEMVENATKYVKLEKKEDLDFNERNLREIIDGVIKDFEYIAKKKNIEIIFEGKNAFARVHRSIADLISNLISNAIKYSPEGSKIMIGLEDKKDSLLIYVKDYGVGVPDKYKEVIFERFKRIKRHGVKGSGLGLAIVKRVAEIHDGKVWVENNPEKKGSIFYVEIPKKRKK